MALFKKFASVGGATMASRVLGFVREMMIAAFLGTGPVADAFYAALRFPNLFRRLFAEGAFNAAFIPLFAKRLEESETSAKQFASEVFSVLLVILLIISTLAIAFMPWLVGTVVAPKFITNPDKFELTILLTRIMFPYLAAMSLVAMLAGILNSLRKYFLAALAPVLLNVVLILALSASAILNYDANQIGILLAISVTISGILQFGLLLWATRREGFVPKWQTPKLTPSVKRLLWLALPAAITGGITQINLIVGQIIASAQDGAIAIINYADRLMQLPLGVIGIAIGVVLLPELSRALKADQKTEVMALQNKSLEFALLLTLPSAIGLGLLAKPIIVLLFERGAFDRVATDITSAVLAIFVIGLPAFVISKVFTPSYYVRENMRWPMWCSAASVAANIIGSLMLFPTYGVVGIAVATAISGWVNAIMLMVPLMQRKHFVIANGTMRRVVTIIAASAGMGVVLNLADLWFADLLIDAVFVVQMVSLLAVIAVAAVCYFAIVLLFSGYSPQDIKEMFKR
ncbi:MAG: murein biosynthesis integral membrane protein MurJ [Rhizobiaceae bacterium]|nr:murein biosynthesis integral membrane protein MurJ [Rhizobiaceae bacterium]